MAARASFLGKKIIVADNGTRWFFRRGYVVLSNHSGEWTTTVQGLTYRLVRFGGDDPGWCLYLGEELNPHFYGEPCGLKVMAAIDKATELITKADLRGEGYEKRG